VALSSDNTAMFGGSAKAAALSELPAEVAEMLAKVRKAGEGVGREQGSGWSWLSWPKGVRDRVG